MNYITVLYSQFVWTAELHLKVIIKLFIKLYLQKFHKSLQPPQNFLMCFLGKVWNKPVKIWSFGIGKPSRKKSNLSADIVHMGGGPPHDSTDTRGVLFFLPSYTPGNAYREVYTMAFSSISHQDLKYAWYLGTSVKCFSTKYNLLLISTHK